VLSSLALDASSGEDRHARNGERMAGTGEVVAAARGDAESDVRLRLLDGFELRQNGARVELPLAAQRLLAFLALHNRPMTRLYVAGALWIDASEERSRANLRATLWRLRKPGAPLVEASSTHVRLGSEVVVDVASLVSSAQEMLRGHDRDGDLEDACLGGDLLPDWYDEWVLEERERLRQLRVHALEALAERLAARERFGQAIEAALAAVRAEPLRESSERVLIKVHLAEGNHGEALRRYLGYRRRLRDALGIEPSRQMTELVAELTRRARRERVGDGSVTPA